MRVQLIRGQFNSIISIASRDWQKNPAGHCFAFEQSVIDTVLEACKVKPGKPQSGPLWRALLIFWWWPGCVHWRAKAPHSHTHVCVCRHFCLRNERAFTISVTSPSSASPLSNSSDRFTQTCDQCMLGNSIDMLVLKTISARGGHSMTVEILSSTDPRFDVIDIFSG